jgi:hypothetical protein
VAEVVVVREGSERDSHEDASQDNAETVRKEDEEVV